jgi:hypothetical protein
MRAKSKPGFKFSNEISPRYIEPLLLHVEYGEWYDTEELKEILRANGLDVEGSFIVNYNTMAWSLTGLGHTRREKYGRSTSKVFQLTRLGKQVIDTYSTNQPLFFDLMHYFFYSAWHRSKDDSRVRFWLYSSVCDALWSDAPAKTDSFALTNRLQLESREAFPDYDPTFSERSVRAVFPWLGALTPAFLIKSEAAPQLSSNRRSYCSPQLFHLATDLVYTLEGLRYGTSMAIDERHIAAVCRVCLLDSAGFWRMADLTKMTIRGYDIRKGQWGTSIALEGPPTWIDLPDFEGGVEETNDEVEEEA